MKPSEIAPAMSAHQGPLLVISPMRWDEACFSVPILRAMVAGGLAPLVLCAEEMFEFWQSVPDLEIMTHAPKAKAKQIAVDLSAQNFLRALMWEHSPLADAARCAKIAQRIGPEIDGLKKYLTQAMPVSDAPLDHRMRFYLQIAENMGIDASKPEFFAPLGSSLESRNDQILLCPDSDFGSSHEWRLDRWQEIARRLIDAGKKPLVICMEEGRKLGARLAEALGDEVDRQSLASPANAFGLLSDHRLLIAADGSVPHLASHFGMTCVVLFGPNDPNWKRPLGKRHAIVRHHVECAPCLLEKCPLDLRCQNELGAERVWTAIETALAAMR